MNAATAFKQHSQIGLITAKLAEVNAEIFKTNIGYWIFFVVTFILYFLFSMTIYVTDVAGLASWIADNSSETFAMVLYMVLSVGMAAALAGGKHIAYDHLAKYRNAKPIAILIVALLVAFALWYESIVSSSQQQHIAHTAAEKSTTVDKMLQAQSGTGANTSYTSRMITAAEVKLATCNDMLARKAVRHCKESETRLQSAQRNHAEALASNERMASANTQAIADQAAADKENAHKPVIKAVRDSFDASINEAVMLVMLSVSAGFEFGHLLLIFILHQKVLRRDSLEQTLLALNAKYLESTGKTFNQEDFNGLDIAENNGAPFPAMGFGSPAIAQFKYQQRGQDNHPFTGFVNTNNQPKAERPDTEISTGNKQSLSTWNRELAKSGISAPSDPAMNQHADKAQIDRILQRGQQPLEPTSQLSMLSQTSGLDSSLQAVSDSLYPAWRKAVKSGECSHAKAATQKFIWKHAGDEIQTLTANEVVRIWNCWKQRGANDGLLKSNPKYEAGNRKPEFVLA